MDKLKQVLTNYWRDETGGGVVEIVIVMAILVAIALVFRKQILAISTRLFNSINRDISNIDTEVDIPVISPNP